MQEHKPQRVRQMFRSIRLTSQATQQEHGFPPDTPAKEIVAARFRLIDALHSKSSQIQILR